MRLSIPHFKLIIVFFWTIWWLLAFLTDAMGGLKAMGVITAAWLPHSNYPFLVQSLAPYQVPAWLPPLLFAGIIAWSGLSTALFSLAALTHRKSDKWQTRVDRAFIVSLGLWFAFFLADQVVMKFDLEENHMVQGGFQLLCFLTIHLLPEEKTAK